MDEEKLNISLRKFLKKVGINSQRIIEDKVRHAVNSSKVSSSKNIKITAKIVAEDIDLSESIEGEIEVKI